MQNSEGKGRNSAPTETSGDAETPDVGPIGRTRKEEQRRRLIVAGLSTPALMTLPSRRVWATKCSKSKMMSGNLSAKKASQTALDCEPMACGRSFWRSNDGAAFDGGLWMNESFSARFPSTGTLFVTDTLGSVVDASDGDWELLLTRSAKIEFGTAEEAEMPIDDGSVDYKPDAAKALIKVARELAAAVLNDIYIRWPVPNDQFNFEKNTGFPAGGLIDFWTLPGTYLPPDDDAKAALAASSQVKTAAYDNARDAGHWARRYVFQKQAEKEAKEAKEAAEKAKDTQAAADFAAAEKEAKEQKEAAEDLFKLAKDQVASCEQPIKDLNSLYCPIQVTSGIVADEGAERNWALTGAMLHHRVYGDEVVIYHGATGDTFLLAPPQWEALQLLQDGPCTTSSVSEHLRSCLDLDDIGERGWQIERMMRSLADLDLVQRMTE